MTLPKLFFVLLCTVAAGAAASDLIVYPGNGQSAEQQELDEFQCYKWAREKTGFDPMAQPTASTAPPADNSTSTGKGLVGGALLGAAVGGIADGSDGAGKGAAIGGLMGGMRSRSQQRQHQQQSDEWARQEAARYQEQRNQYNRAAAACLDSRGYSVS